MILWIMIKFELYFSTTVQINDQVEQSDQISNSDYIVLKDSKVSNNFWWHKCDSRFLIKYYMKNLNPN